MAQDTNREKYCIKRDYSAHFWCGNYNSWTFGSVDEAIDYVDAQDIYNTNFTPICQQCITEIALGLVRCLKEENGTV